MRFLRLAGWALLPMLAAVPAGAVTEDNFKVHTTGDLVALCAATPQEPLGTAALNFCHGYVVAAVRLQQIYNAANPRTRMFCLPEPTPNRDQAIADFITWAKADPARLNATPFDTMFTYLGGKYPCTRRK